MRRAILGALAALTLATSASAEIKWDTGWTGFTLDATKHIATRSGSGWNGIAVDTPVTGLHCVEINVTAKSSSIMLGETDSAEYKPGTGSWLGNNASGVGQQDGGNYYVAGPQGTGSPNGFRLTTGYVYVCTNTTAKRSWTSLDLATFYGNSSTGNGITAATVASTPTSGVAWVDTGTGFTATPSPTYFAIACDAACTVTFNGGYQAFNNATALPTGFTPAEALVSGGAKTRRTLTGAGG